MSPSHAADSSPIRGDGLERPPSAVGATTELAGLSLPRPAARFGDLGCPQAGGRSAGGRGAGSTERARRRSRFGGGIGGRIAWDAGTSLTELMMTILLLSVVLGLSMTAFMSIQKATRGADERTLNVGQARLLMQRTTRDLRTAVRLQSDQSPFTLAKPSEAKFYANLSTSGAPSLVRFYLDSSSRLIEERTDAGGTAPNWTFTGTAKSRYVAEYVVNGSSSTPPFAYYDKSGVALSFDSSCTCLTAADLLKIDSVGITFQVRHSTKLTVAATTLVNRVTLPNLDYLPLTTK